MSETIAGKAGRKRNSLEKSAFNMAMTISLLLLAAVFIIDYMAFSRAADDYYQNAGITLTKMVADTLDPDSVQQLTDEALAAYEGSGYEGLLVHSQRSWKMPATSPSSASPTSGLLICVCSSRMRSTSRATAFLSCCVMICSVWVVFSMP